MPTGRKTSTQTFSFQLMGSDFMVSSVSEAPGPVLAAVYNENIGEVVTIGAGFLTVSLISIIYLLVLYRKINKFDKLIV